MRSAAGHGLPPKKRQIRGGLALFAHLCGAASWLNPPPAPHPHPHTLNPRALPYPLCTRGYCRPYRNAQRRSVGAGDAKEVRTHPSPQCCAVGIPLLCAPTPHPTPHRFLCALLPPPQLSPGGAGSFLTPPPIPHHGKGGRAHCGVLLGAPTPPKNLGDAQRQHSEQLRVGASQHTHSPPVWDKPPPRSHSPHGDPPKGSDPAPVGPAALGFGCAITPGLTVAVWGFFVIVLFLLARPSTKPETSPPCWERGRVCRLQNGHPKPAHPQLHPTGTPHPIPLPPWGREERGRQWHPAACGFYWGRWHCAARGPSGCPGVVRAAQGDMQRGVGGGGGGDGAMCPLPVLGAARRR